MIITLITIGIIIAAVIFWIVENKVYGDWAFFVAMSLTAIGALALIFVSVVIINNKVNEDIDYQNALHEKEVIEYRIDNMEDNIVGNEMLYNDIVEFNNELRSVKKWANNPWTNWFNNQKIATIDYIEFTY